MTQTQKNDYCISSDNKVVDGLYYNLEWIITALAGTLVFITFVMQVYRIPTGSMAETLRGNHFKLRCSQCGYRYDYDFITGFYNYPETYLPKLNVNVVPPMPRCPSCGFYEDSGRPNPADQKYKASNIGFQPFYNENGKPALRRAVSRGDQIFVLKSIYQFFKPKRWDVIVFKNPIQPQINYIKRLIALPGEKVEIIDGDIYIDDKIARKPPHVQEEMWMCVYDNDYQPARPQVMQFNRHKWKLPFDFQQGGSWRLSQDGSAEVLLDTGTDKASQMLHYDSSVGNNFVPSYPYNASLIGESYFYRPPLPISTMLPCSDLMMRYYVKMEDQSAAGVQLSKYGIAYEGWIASDGQMTICRLEKDSTKKVLAEGKCKFRESPDFQLLRFANVDHRLILEYGNSRIEYDFGDGKFDAGMDRKSLSTAAISGFGKLRVRHIKLMRDIYYRGADDTRVLRAIEGNPLALEADEYFVCGDNSPNSYDARMWKEPTKANIGQNYRDGVVPADYLVGKAFFVHFPGSWRFERESWRKIPYLDGAPEPDGIKIIYGGR